MKTPAGREWFAARVMPVVAGLLLGGVLSGGVSPAIAATALPAPTDTLAITLHLEGGPMPALPADAATLRQATHDVLAALTGAAGIMGTDRTVMEKLVRRHRIRSGGTLTTAFLADVRAETGASTLLAVSLVVDGDLLAATGRAVDTATGRVVAVGVAEATLDGIDWHRTLVDVLRRSFPPAAPPLLPAPAVLVLPSSVVGLDQQTARAATHCVLDAALADGRWSLPDPALIGAVAAAAGRDPRRLDAEGRATLIRHFGTPWAIMPEAVSFGFNAAPPNLAPPEGEESTGVRTASADLVLTLQLVDLRSGLVVGMRSLHVPAGNAPGWFGMTRPQTLIGQLREGAFELWQDFHRLLEDASS